MKEPLTEENARYLPDLENYPQEVLILLLGCLIGFILSSLRMPKVRVISEQNIESPQAKDTSTDQQSMVPCCISSTNPSTKVFKGKDYSYLQLLFENQNSKAPFSVCKRIITKTSLDGQWIKIIASTHIETSSERCYFEVTPIKNEYFVRKQSVIRSPRAHSSSKIGASEQVLAVSRTDLIVGFLVVDKKKEKQKTQQLQTQVQDLIDQSAKESNNIAKVLAYGFNGRIYSNGDLRTDEKVVKKNRTLGVFINSQEGFIAWVLDAEEIVGIIPIPESATLDSEGLVLVPFIEMFAVGTSAIVSD